MSRPPSDDRQEPGRMGDPAGSLLPGLGKAMTADRGPFASQEGWTLALEGGAENTLPPPDPYARRSLGLAMVAHGLLVAMLFLGVQWATQQTAPMQAELWSAMPESAVSSAPPPPPPEPVPAPKPEPKPQPKPVAKEEPPPVKPDIALKDDKKKTKEEPKKEPPKEVKKEEPKKEPPKEKEPTKEELKKEQLKREKEEAKRQQELEKLRQAEMEKALADLISKDSPRPAGMPSGISASTAGAGANRDPTYIDRIIAKIRSNLVGSACDSVPGNPEAVFYVEQLRSGALVPGSVRKRKSTGSVGCDDAIERAITKSDPLPTAKEGNYVRELELSFKPKEGR